MTFDLRLDPYEIFENARFGKYAIGSFNFSTAEILKAIVLAAKELNSPIIVSTSEGEANFVGMRETVALVKAWRIGAKIPIFLNLDHGKSLKSIKKALAAGYDMVHFDGSELSYEKNIAETKKAVDFARDFEKTFDKKIIVEGELGYLRGTSSVHKEKLEIKPEDLTSPEQAKEFIEKTGVDSLAVVVGNAHGVFIEGGPARHRCAQALAGGPARNAAPARQPDLPEMQSLQAGGSHGGGHSAAGGPARNAAHSAAGGERLYLDRLAQIKEAVGDKVFLVLHGGSGIPNDDVKKAIESGIVKVNVNTELRVAYHDALEKELEEKPEETTPYKMLEPGLEAVKAVVREKIKLFGSDNKI